jgi:hypothetical protein
MFRQRCTRREETLPPDARTELGLAFAPVPDSDFSLLVTASACLGRSERPHEAGVCSTAFQAAIVEAG